MARKEQRLKASDLKKPCGYHRQNGRKTVQHQKRFKKYQRFLRLNFLSLVGFHRNGRIFGTVSGKNL